MKRVILALLLFIGTFPSAALAQSAPGTALVVSSCGGQSYNAGTNQPLVQDTSGRTCGDSTGGSTTVNQGSPNAGGATNSWPVQGAGTAGTPAGGVVSVQGVSGGTAIPISPSGSTLPVSGNVGGYEFLSSVVPTVQNASYTAGQCLGGLQTISIGTTNSLAGILTQIQVISKGGSVTGIVAYVFSKNPTNSTFTDKTNVVVSQTDTAALVVPPLLITPALVLSAQDTATYGAATNLVGNFVNGSTNTDLYVALVTNATVTPASTTDLRLNIQGTKDAP